MKPFVPPEPEYMERYEAYFQRFLIAMKEHYEEFIRELQDEQVIRH